MFVCVYICNICVYICMYVYTHTHIAGTQVIGSAFAIGTQTRSKSTKSLRCGFLVRS